MVPRDAPGWRASVIGVACGLSHPRLAAVRLQYRRSPPSMLSVGKPSRRSERISIIRDMATWPAVLGAALLVVAAAVVAGCAGPQDQTSVQAPSGTPVTTREPRATPSGPPPSDPAVQLSAGRGFACAVRASSELRCWGDNEYMLEADTPLGSYRSVSAGGGHACAVHDESGAVRCWGNENYGLTSAPSGKFRSVSAGGTHTCAVREAGSVSCWGDTSNEAHRAFVRTYRSVSAGYSHTCAIRESGEIDCWGRNDRGEATAPPVSTAWSARAMGSRARFASRRSWFAGEAAGRASWTPPAGRSARSAQASRMRAQYASRARSPAGAQTTSARPRHRRDGTAR